MDLRHPPAEDFADKKTPQIRHWRTWGRGDIEQDSQGVITFDPPSLHRHVPVHDRFSLQAV
jgi:hypothetical protein